MTLSRSLLLCVCLIVSSGCARSPGDQQTLRFWVMGREGEVIQQVLPEFERRNPGVRVLLQQLPWTAAHEKLLTAFAGDSLPDICQLGNTWLSELAALDALTDLEPRIATSKVVDKQDYFEGILRTNVFEGRVFGVPWYVDTRVLFYRTDLLSAAGFQQPPRNWSEWKQQLQAIKREVGPNNYSILLPSNEFEPLLVFALQQRDGLLRDNGGRGDFKSEGFRRALDLYAEMFRNGWAPTVAGAEISNVWNEFGRGFFSFYITGPWNIEEFKQRLPEKRRNDWMTAPMPGPDGPGVSTAGGSSLVIFRSTRHADAAWRLIEFLSEPEVQVRFHELSGNLPPRRTTWKDPRLAGNRYANAFREQLERTRPAPQVPEWERIAAEMQQTAEQVVIGGKSINDAVRELDAKVDVILEKRRWMLAHGAKR